MLLTPHKEKLQINKKIYLKIKINPGKNKSEIKNILKDNTIKINISSPPLRNKANQDLIKLLSKKFDINKEKIKIISGKTKKLKIIKIQL